MSEACVLAIDLGTGGPKVAVIDPAGRTLAWRSRPVDTTFIEGGGAEQDPRQMWSAIVEATRATLDELSPRPPIAAMAVTSQYMSTIPVARRRHVDRPMRAVDGHAWRRPQPVAADRRVVHVVRRAPRPDPASEWQRQHRPRAHVADAPSRLVRARVQHSSSRWTSSTLASPDACVRRSRRCSVSWCATTVTWGTTEYDPDLVAATQLDPDKLAPLVADERHDR